MKINRKITEIITSRAFVCFNSVFYIGFSDNKICIGNKYHKLEHEDERDIIPVNYRITQLHRKPAL